MTSETGPDAETGESAAEPGGVTALPEVPPEGSDQVEMPFTYDHGRMPFFMKVIWIGFMAFATWYVTVNMLDALNVDLGS